MAIPFLRFASLSASPLALLFHWSSSEPSDSLVPGLEPLNCGSGSSLGSGGTTWGRQPEGKLKEGGEFIDRGLECEGKRIFVGDTLGVVDAALGHSDIDSPWKSSKNVTFTMCVLEMH